MKESNTASKVRNHIKRLRKGAPFTTASFKSFGSKSAIVKALSRLSKEGVIERLGKGIYIRPTPGRFTPFVRPLPIEVAKAVAKGADPRAKVFLHGAEAVRRLGLSTQLQVRPHYSTTGPNQSFTYGKLKVVLQHVPERVGILAGRPAGTALAALYYLGKKGVTQDIVAHIESKLPSEEFAALRSVRGAMPEWLQALLD